MKQSGAKSLMLLLTLVTAVSGQTAYDSVTVTSTDSLFLKVVYPETDTLFTPFNRQRIAASTLPLARAFLNGKEARVYASGAFVGLVNLDVGPNPLRMVVYGSGGDSLWKDFVLMRAEPAKNSSRDTLVIEEMLMKPAEDLWLGTGDVLEVRFKGSPGYEAYFDIDGIESGIPMKELSPREAGGFEGVYVGSYRIREHDEARGVPVEFRLRKSFWSSERAVSKGLVTIAPSDFPRVVELTGKRPFLNVGLGEDRLGGAKLGYLQPGIRLMVTGKVGRQFRVKLADSIVAWLPEDFAVLLPKETPEPRSFVGSIMAVGDSKEDILTVALSQRLPYTSEQQVNLPAVVVDVFGATSNTNWITHHLSAEGIRDITWKQVADRHYRLTITLKAEAHWGYDIGYDSGPTLRIRLRRPPLVLADSVLKGMVIAVDAGHGGENQGALGATGAREMDVSLAMAGHLEAVLRERGAKVIMTRRDSTGLGMNDRTETILSANAHLLISIHCNSVGFAIDPERVKGTGTFYRYAGFKPLADAVYTKLLQLGLEQFGVVGSFNFSLNGLTQLPTVLVETAFLSHPEDEMKLLDDAFRRRIAEKVTEGVETFVAAWAIISPQISK